MTPEIANPVGVPTPEPTKPMTELQLARLFVWRAELLEQLAEVDNEITNQILLAGKTTSIAGITASYYTPSDTIDYRALAENHLQRELDDGKLEQAAVNGLIASYTNETITASTSWKSICEALELDLKKVDPEFVTTKPARVAIKP